MNMPLETLDTVRLFVESAHSFLRASPQNPGQALVCVDAALKVFNGGEGTTHRQWSLDRRMQHARRMRAVARKHRAMRERR